MLSAKALAARLRLLRKEGVSEFSDGDFRVVLGPRPGDEKAVQAAAQAPAPPRFPRVEPDPENAADLVLSPPSDAELYGAGN